MNDYNYTEHICVGVTAILLSNNPVQDIEEKADVRIGLWGEGGDEKERTSMRGHA